MDIPGLARKYKSARRLQQIINVFLKYGYGQIIDQAHLGIYIPFKKRLRSFGAWPSVKGPTAAERLRMAFAELGPSFIKLAQLLSSRPDLITDQYANEFKKLQDEVPPFPAQEARNIMEEDLRRPLESAFVSFDQMPIAAASIAQVHLARLRSGEDVAVKIQRPDIREQIESDITIMAFFSRLLEKHVPESRFFNPSGIVDEFSRTVRKELDFIEEARNCARLRKNFENFAGVHIPKIYEELSTGKVLVIERVRGVRIDDVAGIEKMGVDKKKLARHSLDVYFKQILEDGFFHADPHPGNILIMPGGVIAFVDFGIVGRVADEVRETIAGALMALIRKDLDSFIDYYIELGIVPEEIDTDSLKREFKADLADLIEPLYGMRLQDIRFATLMDEVTRLALRHNLKVPAEMLLINKTLLMLDNLCRLLDPEIDVIAASEPYASKLALKSISPSKVYEKARKNVKEIADFAQAFPRQMKRLLNKTVRDDLQIKMYHVNLPEFIKDMDKASNRIAFAMIVSAIILSSAILHAAGVLPTIFGLSSLGIITFVVAFFLGIWLLVSIIRSGRL